MTEIRHKIGLAGSLVLNNVSGSVNVRATDVDEVIVVARSASGRGEPEIDIERGPDSLRVEPRCQRGRSFLGGSLFANPQNIDFEVSLPRSARLSLKCVSADVRAEGLAGEQSYKTVSGDLILASTGGQISLTTVSGDARVQANLPLELEANTTSGDLWISAERLGLVQIRTVSGDVELHGGFTPNVRHTVESVSGDLVVEPVGGLTVETRRALDIGRGKGQDLVTGDGAASLRFRSMSGDVRLAGGRPGARRAPASRVASPPPTAGDTDALEVLRALERGEIDVDEATRRLEETKRG